MYGVMGCSIDQPGDIFDSSGHAMTPGRDYDMTDDTKRSGYALTDQRIFWRWFEQNEARFAKAEGADKEQLLDELLDVLQSYCPNLWFETGLADDGIRELIVSAEGDRTYFSDVRTLIATAPEIAGWRFIAFKPAQGFDFTTEFAEIIFSPVAAWFLPLSSNHDPSALGLRIGYAHFDSERAKDFLAGTFIMLECGLGEIALADQVQHVEVAALPSSPESSGYLPLTELGNWLADRNSWLD